MATIDVRPDIAAGREPFLRIMEAVKWLGPDEVLELIAPFEPAPLYEVLSERGFDHTVELRADGAWLVTFKRILPR